VSGAQPISLEGAIDIEWYIEYTKGSETDIDIKWTFQDYDYSAFIDDLDSAGALIEITLAASIDGYLQNQGLRGARGKVAVKSNGDTDATVVIRARAVYAAV